MKTRPFFRIACFLLCASLLLSGCGEEIQTPEEETVSIWLVEGELLAGLTRLELAGQITALAGRRYQRR